MTRRARATLFVVALLAIAIGVLRLVRPRERGGNGEPHDDSFVALRSLREARDMDHTAVIMQGGDGDRIYLTVPTKYVRCGETALRALLALFDGIGCRKPASAALSFELAPVGSGVYGGSDGGQIVDGVWVHPEFEARGLRAIAASVIAGETPIGDARERFRRPL